MPGLRLFSILAEFDSSGNNTAVQYNAHYGPDRTKSLAKTQNLGSCDPLQNFCSFEHLPLLI